jgi:heptosyltransferase-2
MVKKICIIKLGALGDVVRTLPIAKALKAKEKESEIVWVTKENALGLFEANPYVDEVVVIGSDLSDRNAEVHGDDVAPRTPPSLRTLQNLGGFDVLYNFDIEEEAGELAKEIKADAKFGFYLEEGYPTAFNPEAEYYINTIFDDRLKKENKKTYQRMMFETAGLVWDESHCELFLKDDEKKKARAFLKKQGRDEKKRLIGLHIGASKRWPSKMWHSDNIKEFVEKAVNRGYEVILFAGLDEKDIQKKLVNEINSRGIKVYTNNPNNSIREFAGLVNECSCIVCGDSFALHVALALRKKTIGLFFCTTPHEIEGYGLLRKIIANRLWEVFPEKMDVYDEELVRSISAEKVMEEVEGI